MSFSATVPVQTQSPGVFPVQNQNNMGRLKTIIDVDHRFNDTAQATDGFHEKISFLSVPIFPPTIPPSANALMYTSDAAVAGQHELYFLNSVANYKLTPLWTGQLQGTVNVSAVYNNIVAIPANVWGEIYLYFNRFIQFGVFVSDATVVNGYSAAEKFQTGSGASQILRLGFDGDGANLLNLTVKNDSGGAFNGLWTYRLNYRLK